MTAISPKLLDYLTDAERRELETLLMQLPVWEPDSRNAPQVQAHDSPAHETLYGGAAGGGKSDLLLGLARTKHRRSLLLRREFPDLERSLIARAYEFYGDRTHYNASKHIWNIPDGGITRWIEFGHMERVGSASEPGDEASYASAPYDLIAFDQLEQFPQYAYEFMFSRARSTIPGQRVRIFASANFVGAGVAWIMKRWAAWLDDTHPMPAKGGEIRWYKRNEAGEDVEAAADDPDAQSRTFIPARLADNPYLDDEYRKQLNNLPEPLRSALLNGDIKASLQDDAYQVVPRAWVQAAMLRWTPEPPEDEKDKSPVIGNDIAHGGEDQTVFALRRGSWFDKLQKHSGRSTPTGGAVCDLLTLIIGDGSANMDIIGVGASAYDEGRRRGMKVYPVNFSEDSTATDKSGRLHFLNKRAEFYWTFREALDPESGQNIALPPDLELEGDLCTPRWSSQVRGIKIESKDEIKKRIGRSPDCGDAVVLSWGNVPQWVSF
jgi:hypothetical protein